MTHISATAGSAQLLLISDAPIDDELWGVIRQLYGAETTDGDLTFSAQRRSCQWPCRVTCPSSGLTSLRQHVFLCAAFLSQRRSVVQRLHELGCNLELCLHVSGLTEHLSLAAATMKQLADLHIQLSFIPTQV